MKIKLPPGPKFGEGESEWNPSIIAPHSHTQAATILGELGNNNKAGNTLSTTSVTSSWSHTRETR